MARMPGTEWRGPTVNEGDGDGRPGEADDAIVDYWYLIEHIAEGTFEGTIAWQKNPSADVSSHFVVSRTGRIAQMVDTHDRAWTQRAGNSRAISIENEGHTPNPLTDAQVVASAKILAWVHREHGIPLRITNTPASKGLGHHSMGAENGYDWGHSACPGPAIKAQKPEILARAVKIVNGESGGDVYGTVSKGTQGDAAEYVQLACLEIDPKALPQYGPDMDYGDETASAVARLFGGDGSVFGPAQAISFQRKLAERYAGKPGPAGKDGKDGKTPVRVAMRQVADVIEVQ